MSGTRVVGIGPISFWLLNEPQVLPFVIRSVAVSVANLDPQPESVPINTLVATSNHLLRSNVKGYVFHPPYGYGAINYYYLWKE